MSKARILLPIEGMSCAACAATVQKALGTRDGVTSAAVNYATGKATVDYDDARVHVGELIQTVRAAGYDCGKASVTFAVYQLHYAPSVTPLEQALRRVPGVVRAVANQATETVSVDYVLGAATAEDLERAVTAAGFQVAEPIAAEDPLERERLARRREIRALAGKLTVAAVATVVTMLGSMLLMTGHADATLRSVDLLGRLLLPLALRVQEALPAVSAIEPYWIKLTLAALTLPVVVWSGQQFYRGTWSGLKHRSGVPVFAGGHLCPGPVGRRGARGGRLLRIRVRHHRPHPAGPAARGAGQGAHVAGDSPPGGAPGEDGPRGARRQGGRDRGRDAGARSPARRRIACDVRPLAR